MSFKEVTNLRKEGKLEEALVMAEQDFRNDPNGEWPKRAIALVYYSYLKKTQEKNDLKEMITNVEKITNLNLPDNEKLIFDNIAWSLGKYLYANKTVSEDNLNRLFELIKDFPFTKPKNSYSFLLKAYSKHSQNWSRFVEFTRWWGMDNFLHEDYEPFITEGGRKVTALVESIYISISKKLLILPLNIDLIKRFIPRIAKVSAEYKNMQYPPYYYAKLQLAIGDIEGFIKAFLPFARKKRNDFWVWNLLSEIYSKDSEEYFSCLCKSLSCRAPAKFTINVKEKLARVFETNEQYPQAKTEYVEIIDAITAEGWNLKDKHKNWQLKSWWNDTKPPHNNYKIYNANIDIAEKLLFADKPETLIAIDIVNKEKTVFSFIASKELEGFIHYGKLKLNPNPGDIYAVRFKEQPKDNKSTFRQVYSIHKTEKTPSDEIFKTVEGKITIKPGNSFGFINNIFVSGNLIKNNKLKDGQLISIVALLSFNKKKKSWGWKGVRVI